MYWRILNGKSPRKAEPRNVQERAYRIKPGPKCKCDPALLDAGQDYTSTDLAAAWKCEIGVARREARRLEKEGVLSRYRIFQGKAHPWIYSLRAEQ